ELLESIEEGPRLHVLACGRRAGKTSIGAAAAVWDATLRPVLARYLRPGERRYAVCVAVNLRQARHFVSICRALVESSPLLRRLLVTASDDELVFSTGCTIAAFPCTARGGRGWPISTLVLDEHAHHVDLEGSNIAAEQVWRALAPSTYQFGHDGRIVVASTPWGTEGHFAELFKRVQGGAEGRVYQYASHELNTALDPETLAEEFANDPDAYRSEVLAEFVPGGGNYIDPVRLADAVGGHGTLGRLGARLRPRLLARSGGGGARRPRSGASGAHPGRRRLVVGAAADELVRGAARAGGLARRRGRGDRELLRRPRRDRPVHGAAGRDGARAGRRRRRDAAPVRGDEVARVRGAPLAPLRRDARPARRRRPAARASLAALPGARRESVGDDTAYAGRSERSS